MKVAKVGILAAAILAVATMAFAQKPDFSGTWTLDPEATGTAGGAPPAAGAPPAGAPAGGGRGGGGLLGQSGTIKQTADTLTVDRTMGENKVTAAYKLDGTESKNTGMGRGGTPMESVSTAKWDANKLIITTKAGENETTQVLSLAGNVLTIETTNARGMQKRVYKKTT